MKKKIALFVLFSMMVMGVVSAANINGTYKGKPIVNVVAGGKDLAVTDAPAVIMDGRTMVPISLLKQLGVGVVWDQESYSAIITMPETKPVVSEDKSSVYKKAAFLADYYKYLNDQMRATLEFVNVTDTYIRLWKENSVNKPSDEALQNVYNNKFGITNEIYLRGLEVWKVADQNELVKTGEILVDCYELTNIVGDVYEKAYGWKFSQFDSGSSGAAMQVASEYLNEYSVASQKLLDDTNALILRIDIEYDKQMGYIIN